MQDRESKKRIVRAEIPVQPGALWQVADLFSAALGILVAVSLKLLFRPFFHIAKVFNDIGETTKVAFNDVFESQTPFLIFVGWFVGAGLFGLPVYLFIYAPLHLIFSLFSAVVEGVEIGVKYGLSGALRSIFNSVNWRNEKGYRYEGEVEIEGPLGGLQGRKTRPVPDKALKREFITVVDQINPYSYYFGPKTLLNVAIIVALAAGITVLVLMLSAGFTPIPFVLAKLGYAFSGVFYNLLITPLGTCLAVAFASFAGTLVVEAALYVATMLLYEVGALLALLDPRLYFKENAEKKTKAYKHVGRSFRDALNYVREKSSFVSVDHINRLSQKKKYSSVEKLKGNVRKDYAFECEKTISSGSSYNYNYSETKYTIAYVKANVTTQCVMFKVSTEYSAFFVIFDLVRKTYLVNDENTAIIVAKLLSLRSGSFIDNWLDDGKKKYQNFNEFSVVNNNDEEGYFHRLVEDGITENHPLTFESILPSEHWLGKKNLSIPKWLRGLANFAGFFVLLPLYLIITPFLVVANVLNDVVDAYSIKMNVGNFVLATVKSTFLLGIVLPLLVIVSPFIAVYNLAMTCNELQFSDALKAMWENINITDEKNNKYRHVDDQAKISTLTKTPLGLGREEQKIFPSSFYFGTKTILTLAVLAGVGSVIAASVLLSGGTSLFAFGAAKLGIELTFAGASLLLTPVGAAIGAFILGAAAVLVLAASIYLIVGTMNAIGNFFRYIDPDDDQEYNVKHLPNDLYNTLDEFFDGKQEFVAVQGSFDSVLNGKRDEKPDSNDDDEYELHLINE